MWPTLSWLSYFCSQSVPLCYNTTNRWLWNIWQWGNNWTCCAFFRDEGLFVFFHQVVIWWVITVCLYITSMWTVSLRENKGDFENWISVPQTNAHYPIEFVNILLFLFLILCFWTCAYACCTCVICLETSKKGVRGQFVGEDKDQRGNDRTPAMCSSHVLSKHLHQGWRVAFGLGPYSSRFGHLASLARTPGCPCPFRASLGSYE